MLMTELRLGQSLTIDGTIVKMVKFNSCKGGSVRLAIDADDRVKIEFEKKESTHNNTSKRHEMKKSE